jgi:hypothetical protein
MKIFTSALFALLMILFSLTARSQEIEVDPGEKVTIKGIVGDDTSFNGDIRVTVKNSNQAAIPKLQLVTSDLKRADGEQIRRGLVDVGKEITATPDVATTIPIKITGVKLPGEYTGKLEVRLVGQPQDKTKTLDLTVLANVRNTLTALANADRLKANLVNCMSPCWLAKWILPGSTQTDYAIKFERPVGAPESVIETEMDVKGEKNGFQWTANHLKLGQPAAAAPASTPTPQAGQSVAQSTTSKRFLVLPAALTYSGMPADHYTGTIYLAYDANMPLIKLPVDVNVRVAPLWPLLVLVIGILLGKLIKFMQEKGGPAADAQIVFNRLDLRLGGADSADQRILEQQMQNADRLINESQPAEATAQIKLIGARLTTLESLRAIEARLAGKEQHPTVQEVLGQIKQARERINQADDEKTRALVKVIQDSVATLANTLMDSNNLPHPDIAAAAVDANAAAESSRTAAVTTRPIRRNWLTQSLARFSGVAEDLRAETALFVVRPLLWLVLIIGLVALGMKSLYIDNPTFGASAVDYVSLIFWGMSSDVASRALGSLKFT